MIDIMNPPFSDEDDDFEDHGTIIVQKEGKL